MMLSGALERNNRLLPLPPFGKDGIRAPKKLLQGMRRESDLIVSVHRREKHMIAAKLQCGRLFRKVTICPVHSPLPPRSYTERFGSGARREAKRNGLNPFDSPVFDERPCSAADTVPDFANDNEPLREAEAA